MYFGFVFHSKGWIWRAPGNLLIAFSFTILLFLSLYNIDCFIAARVWW